MSTSSSTPSTQDGSGDASIIAKRLRALQFKAHGNWCGPRYGGGQYTDSPDWKVESTDAFDEVCKKHDWDYGHMPKEEADSLMIQRLMKIPLRELGVQGIVKGQLAALAFHLFTGGKRPTTNGGPYPWETKSRAYGARADVRMTDQVVRATGLSTMPQDDHDSQPLKVVEVAREGSTMLTKRRRRGDKRGSKRRKITAEQYVVEKNPGPGTKKGRSKKGFRKGRSKKARTRSKKKTTRKKQATIAQLFPVLAPSRKGKKGKGATTVTIDRQGVKTVRSSCLVYQGTVDNTVATGTQTPGTIVWSAPITPGAAASATDPAPVGIPDIDALYESAKWENFLVTSLRVRVKPTGNDFAGGRYIGYIDMDVDDAPPSGIAALQKARIQGGTSITMSKGGSFGYTARNRATTLKRYFTTPNATDARFWAQGKIWLLLEEYGYCYSSAGAQTGVKVPIEIFVDWTIQFSNRTLEPTGSIITGSGSGWVIAQSASAAVAAHPLSVNNFTVWATGTSVVPNTLNGLILAYDGSADYVLFAAGSPFELVTQVIFNLALILSGATSPTLTSVAVGGASISSTNYSAGSAGAEVAGYVVTLPGAAAAISSFATVTNAYQYTGGWNTLLTPGNVQVYGGIKLTCNLGGGTWSSTYLALALGAAYIPTIQDRMLLCAGPATEDGRYLPSWSWDKPLLDHVAGKVQEERKRASSIEALAEQNMYLQARLDALKAARVVRSEEDSDEERILVGRPGPSGLALTSATEHKEFKAAAPRRAL